LHLSERATGPAEFFKVNRRIFVIVACALVISLCASYLVYRAVRVQRYPRKAPPTVELVVAAHDLAVGTLVRDADLNMAGWTDSVAKGAILKRADALNRGVVSPIYEGEVVTENRLAPKGSDGGLAATIPPGMRACAVKVNEVVGVAGFVGPGARVDVLMTGFPPGGNTLDGPKVKTLLQNIQVLSAGTNFQRDREGKPEQVQVVNLLVTPSQAEILSLASNETHIQLVLRNPMDTAIFAPPGRIMSDLFGAERPPERILPRSAAVPPDAPARSADTYTIEVFNGAVHTQAKFVRPAEAR
jgi:pilus assembly protein CpaB